MTGQWGNPANANLKHGVNNGMIPKEGPKTIRFSPDFTAQTSVLIDMSQQNALEQLSFIQGVFIDNTGNGQSLMLMCEGTGQTITVPAGAQGYVPLLATVPNKFLVGTTGGVVVNLFFYNIPMPAELWGEGGAFSFDANGYLQVAEPNLDALISDEGSGNGLAVNVLSGGGGSGGVSGLKPVVVSTSGGTAVTSVQILVPGATNKFKVTGITVLFDNNCYNTNGSAAFSEFTVYEAGANYTLALWAKYIATAPPANWGNRVRSEIIYQSPPGFYYESSAVNNNLLIGMPGYGWGGGKMRVHVNAEIFTP